MYLILKITIARDKQIMLRCRGSQLLLLTIVEQDVSAASLYK